MALLMPTWVMDWWKLAAGMLLGALLCAPLAYCEGKKAERSHWNAKVAEIARQAAEIQRLADEVRRHAEQLDRARIASNRQEVDNAVRDIPDQGLTDRQRARVCVELRRQNAPAEQLAAACGPSQPR